MFLGQLVVCENIWGKKEKEAIINSFIYSNFNYCPRVWHFCSCKTTNKIEQIQKRCLRIILNNNESDNETLIEKSSKTTININRMRNLAIEMLKTIYNLNSPFLKKMFKTKVNPSVRPNDIMLNTHNTASYGDKSLTVLDPKIWNSVPENVKSECNYRRFKEYINTWFDPKCFCTYYKYFTRTT